MEKKNYTQQDIIPFALNVLTALTKQAQSYLSMQAIRINERLESGEPPQLAIIQTYDSGEERLSIFEEQEAMQIIIEIKDTLEECISEISISSGFDVQKALTVRSAVILSRVYMMTWLPNHPRVKNKIDSGVYYFPDIFRLFSSYTLYELGHYIEKGEIDDQEKIDYIDGAKWARALLHFSYSEHFNLFRLGNVALYIGGRHIES